MRMTANFGLAIIGSRSASTTAASKTVKAGMEVSITIRLRCFFMETMPGRSEDILINMAQI